MEPTYCVVEVCPSRQSRVVAGLFDFQHAEQVARKLTEAMCLRFDAMGITYIVLDLEKVLEHRGSEPA